MQRPERIVRCTTHIFVWFCGVTSMSTTLMKLIALGRVQNRCQLPRPTPAHPEHHSMDDSWHFKISVFTLYFLLHFHFLFDSHPHVCFGGVLMNWLWFSFKNMKISPQTQPVCYWPFLHSFLLCPHNLIQTKYALLQT